MKKRRAMLLAVFFLLISAGSLPSAVENQRLAWWKLHRSELEKERAAAEKEGALDATMKSLLEREVRRSSEVIAIFQKHALREGSLTDTVAEGKDASDALLRRRAAAAGDLVLLKNLILNWKRYDLEKIMMEPARRRASDLARRYMGGDTAEVVELFITRDITPVQRRRISREMLMEASMRERKKLQGEIARRAAEKLQKKFPPGEETSRAAYEKVLVAAVAETAQNYFYPLKITFTDDDLKKSAMWHYCEEMMHHNFRVFGQMQKMIPKDFVPGKIRYLFRDPLAMDGQIFIEKKGVVTKKDKARLYFHRRVDALRRRYLATVTGKTVSLYTRRFLKGATRLAAQYTARQKAALLYAKKELKNLEAPDSSVERTSLERAIKKECARLEKMRTEAQNYITRSERLLQWRGDNALPKAKKMKAMSERFIREQGRYVLFIGSIGRGASALGDGRGSLSGDVRDSLRRLDVVYRDMIERALPGKEVRHVLMRRDLASLAADLRLLKGEIRGMQSSLVAEYRQVRRGSSRRREKSRARHDRALVSIAQYEMDQVVAGLRDYAAALDHYSYAETLLACYKVRADGFIASLRRGKLPPETEKIIKNKSLLMFVKEYDAGKLKAESAARRRLIRGMRQRVSRVRGLISWYGRRGIEIREHPDADQLAAFRRKWQRHPAVVVAGRRIVTENLLSEDIAASRYVRDLAVRNIWKSRNGNGAAPGGKKQFVRLDEKVITVTIPRGWQKIPSAGNLPGRFRVSEFLSLDGSASISLASVPAQKKDAREVSRRWILRRSSQLLKHRWGKREKGHYYWARGRDKHDNVFELYALASDGHVLIIEGTSPGEKYPLLKEKLHSVFTSLRQ